MIRAGWAAFAAAAGLAACASPVAPSPPSQSEAYANYLVGRVATRLGDFQAASDRYAEALGADPGDAALLNGAVTASLASGDLSRARALARVEATDGQVGAYARLVRAVDSIAAGRYARASEELDLIEGDAAEELTARLLSTWALTARGGVDETTVELDRLVGVRPYGALFAYQQAMALDFADQEEAARSAYAQAAEGGLWLAPAALRHADLLARNGARQEAAAVLDPGATGPDSEAVARARALIAARGRAVDARLTPARGAAIGLMGLGAVLMQENDTTRGLVTLSLALMLDPELDGARMIYAEGQERLGRNAAARATLAETAASSPYYESARLLTAWLLKDEGREQEALALALDNAAAGGPRATRALADMYRSLNRYGDAEPLYTQLLEADGDNWRLYFARGAARERLGRMEEAEVDLARALALEPEQPDVMNYLGYLWVDRGVRLDEGLALIQRAVELRPASAAIIDSLGWAYYRLGEFDRALEHLERAVELAPADATLNDHLGDLYWRLDRRTEARFQWRRALSLNPDRPGDIEAKLEAGLPATQSAAR